MVQNTQVYAVGNHPDLAHFSRSAGAQRLWKDSLWTWAEGWEGGSPGEAPRCIFILRNARGEWTRELPINEKGKKTLKTVPVIGRDG